VDRQANAGATVNVELRGLEETIREIVRQEVAAALAPGTSSPWMKREAAARYLGVPVSRLEKSKAIPCHREGRRVLYHRAELDAYLLE
jgi:hypothetical protein